MKDKIIEIYNDNIDTVKCVVFISVIALFWDIVL